MSQMSGLNLSEGFWCGQNIFSNIKKLKNSTNKKVRKLQKLIKDVQKKKSKTEKNKGCTYMPRSIECAHRKYEKVFTKNKQSYRILEYTVFCSGQGKCC